MAIRVEALASPGLYYDRNPEKPTWPESETQLSLWDVQWCDEVLKFGLAHPSGLHAGVKVAIDTNQARIMSNSRMRAS